MMRITFMTSAALVEAKFSKAAPLLQPVVERACKGEFTVEDLRQLNLKGNAITALVEDRSPQLAMVFEFIHYPQMTAVNIIALGGPGLKDSAIAFWDTFKAWCKEAGASCIEASCSPALARLLKRYGFEDTYRQVRVGV